MGSTNAGHAQTDPTDTKERLATISQGNFPPHAPHPAAQLCDPAPAMKENDRQTQSFRVGEEATCKEMRRRRTAPQHSLCDSI
ncbi:unnamed protein product [Boreogadus saida]